MILAQCLPYICCIHILMSAAQHIVIQSISACSGHFPNAILPTTVLCLPPLDSVTCCLWSASLSADSLRSQLKLSQTQIVTNISSHTAINFIVPSALCQYRYSARKRSAVHNARTRRLVECLQAENATDHSFGIECKVK